MKKTQQSSNSRKNIEQGSNSSSQNYLLLCRNQVRKIGKIIHLFLDVRSHSLQLVENHHLYTVEKVLIKTLRKAVKRSHLEGYQINVIYSNLPETILSTRILNLRTKENRRLLLNKSCEKNYRIPLHNRKNQQENSNNHSIVKF